MSSEPCSSSYARSIVLPCDQIFRNLRKAKKFALDIGGSLAKLAYCSIVPRQLVIASNNAHNGNFSVDQTEHEGIRLHFIKFETKYIEDCLDFIHGELEQAASSSPLRASMGAVKVTGGGAFKYYDTIQDKLDLKVEKEDEIECLIRGCNFLLRNIPDETFTYQYKLQPEHNYRFLPIDPVQIFPYLLVNIGSGVSVIKVESDSNFVRVGGSSMGGGTFWGLGSLLTNAKGFDELLALAEEGDHRNVDMLVSDIYGGSYEKLGLESDLIASSFGKMTRSEREEDKKYDHSTNECDVARSLLLMISNCIGQIASMYAQQHQLEHIYFAGYFIRGHPITMRTISFAIDYWSKGSLSARFLRHEGYLGAVGAFMKGAEEENIASAVSWSERYAGSSGLLCPFPTSFINRNSSTNGFIDLLEMDCADKNLVCCPLLAYPAEYVPDTVDLTADSEAREYWLTCLAEGIDKTVKRAVESIPSNPNATDWAQSMKHSYLQHFRVLRRQPFAYGNLTVRSLLDLKEQLLNEYYFPDAYLKQKLTENEFALKLLGRRLELLDNMSWHERQSALAHGILAGNVFDWGASEIVMLMESSEGLSFDDALEKLQPRPWLKDDLDSWIAKMKECEQSPYKAALIFVDNSGFDIVLGVLPLVRELLRLRTKVILCANSGPALNDVTAQELIDVCKSAGEICPVFSRALTEKRLLLMENGQSSPCLDLSRIDAQLAQTIKTESVDLIILVGMGRAIHTNLECHFVCDVLKTAVIKNQWLAQRLNGSMFGAVFRFEDENYRKIVCETRKRLPRSGSS